jgi:hypothetical protein
MRSQRRTSSNRMLTLEKMNLKIYERMRKRMGGGERRSTNEWCGGGDVRSRSNRNVGTPGGEEREDTRRAARHST